MQNRSIDDDAVSLEPLLRSRKGGHVAGGESEVELHSVKAPLVASDDVKVYPLRVSSPILSYRH